jgi:ribosomal protein S18 acetylase RimI-like enzyme
VTPAEHATPAPVSIRRAGPADAAALSQVGTRTFVETFGHLYAPEDLRAFLDESHAPSAYAHYLDDPDWALWLLEDASGPRGYAMAGPAGLPHHDLRPGDGELKRLYVARGLPNGGWGGKLFARALEWLERDGPRTLWISVWSENLGAQRFYARHGFCFAGEYEFPVGRQRDREFMFRRLPPP